ncbi:MAG: hypothetical protein M0P31_00770 [Solirubrobacteraceae bacterium]|nr:hypothetical protein [Solirubrobacteraceae bacterium]
MSHRTTTFTSPTSSPPPRHRRARIATRLTAWLSTSAAATGVVLAIGAPAASAEGSFTSFVRNVGSGFESRTWFDGGRTRRPTTITLTGCRTTSVAASTAVAPSTPDPAAPSPAPSAAHGGGGTTPSPTTGQEVATKRSTNATPARRRQAPYATVELWRIVRGTPVRNLGAKRVCSKPRSWGRVPPGHYRFRVTRVNGRAGVDRLTARRVRVRY